jgi:hypothetical protein
MKQPPKALTVALQPRDNIGDDSFPTNRPSATTVFLHNNSAMAIETDRLVETYVIDARFISGHYVQKLNGDLNRTLPRRTLFEISHI